MKQDKSEMNKMSTTQTILVCAFSVLLVGCLIQYIVKYQEVRQAENGIQAQSTINHERDADIKSLFNEKEKIIQRGQEMEKLGLHGEARKKSLQHQEKLAEQELQQLQ